MARGGGWREVWEVLARSEGADAHATVRVEPENFVEREDDRRSGGDDRAADDGHLALVHVAAPDGETAVDHARDAEDEPEHHDDSEAVADAGLEVSGTEASALGKGGGGIHGEDGDDQEERRQPRTDFLTDGFDVFDELHTSLVFVVVTGAATTALITGRSMKERAGVRV